MATAWGTSLPAMTRMCLAAVLATAMTGVAGAGALPQPAGGPTLVPETPVTAADLRKAEAHNSPAVVVDPTNSRFVVIPYRQDAPRFSCGLGLSGDGGRGWTAAQPVPKLPAGVDSCYAPEVAFDRSGRLYFLFVGLQGPGNQPTGVFLTTSTDRGRSFSAPRRLLGAHVFGVRMAVDPTQGSRGRIHLVWIQANSAPPLGAFPEPPNPIMSAFSDDGGRSFSSPVQVSDPRRQYVVAPALVLGPSHAVHVLYYDLGDDRRDYQGLEGPVWDGTWSLVLSNSGDGGRSFGPGVVVEGAVVPPERVMLIFTMPAATLAADRSGGLYVGWPDARNHDWDVFVRRSSDRGASWGAPVRVNDDPVGNGRNQYLPRLSVAPDGRVDVVFYDRREDPANVRNHVFYSWSTDRAGSFAPNRRLTSESFDSRIGAQYVGPAAQGLIEFGSRLGLVSTDGRAVVAWTDTRNAAASPNDPTGAAPRATDQDVFAAEVVFGPDREASEPKQSPARWVVIIGAAVVAGLIAGVAIIRRRKHRSPTAALP